MKYCVRGLTLALLMMSIGSPLAAQPLRWKFSAGQELPYRIVKTMQLQIDGAEAGQASSELTQTVDMIWRVIDVDPKGAGRMIHDVTRVQISMRGPLGQGYDFDTAGGEPATDLAAFVAPMLEALVEHDYTVTISAQGEMSDVEAPQDLVDALNRFSEDRSGIPAAPERVAGPICVLLPDHELDPQTPWSQQSSAVVPLFGRQQISTTYRSAGDTQVEGKTFVVVKPKVEVASAVGQQQPITGILRSRDSGGEILFDSNEGRLESSRIDQEMETEIKVEGVTVTGTLKLSTMVSHGEAAAAATGG